MVKITNLCKTYGQFTALNHLNLNIHKGEVFGFVGPNGAGKTTTMRIVSGLLTATSGEVMVDGVDAIRQTKKLKEKIGYMPDFFGVYDNFKAIEYMEFFASIYGIEGKSARKTCMDLLELVNLQDKYDSYVDILSRGMKQRLCLARSLVHNPELLILDEPASGLDPRARFEMKEILKNLADMGKTIIISSHILPELAEICTNIGIITKGTLQFSGTVEEAMSNLNSDRIRMQVVKDIDKVNILLKENPLVKNISIRDNVFEFSFEGNLADDARLLKSFIEQGVDVYFFGREKGNLETLFMEITTVNEAVEGGIK